MYATKSLHTAPVSKKTHSHKIKPISKKENAKTNLNISKLISSSPTTYNKSSNISKLITGNGIQRKLEVGGKKRKVVWRVLRKIRLDHGIQVGPNATKYLQSVIKSGNTHIYKDYKKLATDLQMKDNLIKAARETNTNFAFGSDWIIKSRKWKIICLPTEGSTTACKPKEGKIAKATTKDHYEAIKALFADKKATQFECEGFSQLILLRALFLTVTKSEFNSIISSKIGSQYLTIPINKELMSSESIGKMIEQKSEKKDDGAPDSSGVYTFKDDDILGTSVVPPLKKGENYKPGDKVIFSLDTKKVKEIKKGHRHKQIEHGFGTVWQVENAVCVGYRGIHPLFAGGGVSGEYTERGMKDEILKNLERVATYEKDGRTGNINLKPYKSFRKYITLSRETSKLTLFSKRVDAK